jgi:branched-chain amino acid transport system permease protein
MSGAFAGVAGALSAYFYGLIAPDMLNLNACVMVLFIALLGGVNRLEGALVGALVYVLLEDFFSQYTERYQTIMGIFFVLIVLFLPNGIVGSKFKMNDTLRRFFKIGERKNG